MTEAPSALRARRLPTIGQRLGRLVAVVIGLSLAALATLNLVNDVERYWAAKRETMLTTARLFAAATSGDIAAGDAASVQQTLRAVAQIPGLRRAAVVDPRGRVFAELGEQAYLESDPVLAEDGRASLTRMLLSGSAQVMVPVLHGGETIGQVRLTMGTDDLPGTLLTVVVRSGIVSLGVLAFGLLLASRMQRSLTAPLQDLVVAMSGKGRDNEYDGVREVAQDRETLALARAFNAMVRRIRSATQDILDRESEIIGRLSRAAEQRDDQTGEHVVRVAKVSRIVAEGLGLDRDWIEDLVRASPMHDVGKIAVPDAILFKEGRLDPEERRQMERHALDGHEVLAGSTSALVALAAEIALTHHERWDGTGYPRGLAGEAIPLSGRITAVADVCDALLSERPYKKPWSMPEVRAFLRQNAGSHFDPRCVDALLAHWERLDAIYPGRREPSELPTPPAPARSSPAGATR
jgi:putative two-component system response regulator